MRSHVIEREREMVLVISYCGGEGEDPGREKKRLLGVDAHIATFLREREREM